MTQPTADIQFANQAERHRYELQVDGQLAALIDYRQAAGRIDLLHTEALPAFEGQGLGLKIAQYALDDARSHGWKVVPSCSFIARFIERHPEYQDLLAG
ncbi:MAG TPA: GNAT family N-acetyltransferase [Ramlibacter sp.]|nr:GNAT family N-acetyltransferase [Ramlibacter sp.]